MFSKRLNSLDSGLRSYSMAGVKKANVHATAAEMDFPQ